jgi:hypothetical protein
VTTRKLAECSGWSAPTPARFRRLAVRPPHLLAVLCLFLSGCATSGPNHVYLTTAGSASVRDLGPPAARLAGIVRPDEQAVGLAYDFNTDHLFVRIAPANVIRVIERPSGKILRELPLPRELQADQPSDLAIRSGDRHLFAVHPDGQSVVELTLFGDLVRRLELTGLDGRIGGLAFDQQAGRLLVLSARSPARVGFVGPGGNVTYYVTFNAAVNAVSLGYDSDAQHCFVPLADGSSLGEFDSTGRLVATHPAGGPITALDAGARSFVRVF